MPATDPILVRFANIALRAAVMAALARILMRIFGIA
jgi:hypothetical protein